MRGELNFKRPFSAAIEHRQIYVLVPFAAHGSSKEYAVSGQLLFFSGVSDRKDVD